TAGGVAINTVDAGTATATLRSNAGAMSSANVNNVPDVIANAIVLIGTNNGSFGASPLEIDANTLTATVTGTGSIDVLDTGGGLTVLQAQAASGLISVKAVAADLTLGDATAGPTVVSTTGAVTLTASGGIISGAPAGTTDVAGASLTASAGNGVGSAGTPL